MINILSKNDSMSNTRTSYTSDQVRVFRSDVAKATEIILEAFSGEMTKHKPAMADLLSKPNTMRMKKCEHAQVLVNIYMMIKNITSLMDGSAFGRNTRHNNTNIDLYLRAMDEVEEQANAEVVKKKSAFGQAKPAKFPQGEQQRKYMDLGLAVDQNEMPVCCNPDCLHPFIDLPPLNLSVKEDNKLALAEYLAQKEKLRLWKQNPRANEQPTCPKTGKALLQIPPPEVKKEYVKCHCNESRFSIRRVT
jgi:hypothetical protein